HISSILIALEPTIDENAPNEKDRCTPLVSCPAHLRKTSNSYCRTRTHRQGVLCTTGQYHTVTLHQQKKLESIVAATPISVLSQLQTKSRSEMTRLRSREAALLASKEPPVLLPSPATYGHFRNLRSFDMLVLSEMMHVANSAFQLAIATRAFKDRCR
ncbi:hypothetical protein HUJ04_011772, partial [Dendroctonus ponderosae]